MICGNCYNFGIHLHYICDTSFESSFTLKLSLHLRVVHFDETLMRVVSAILNDKTNHAQVIPLDFANEDSFIIICSRNIC